MNYLLLNVYISSYLKVYYLNLFEWMIYHFGQEVAFALSIRLVIIP